MIGAAAVALVAAVALGSPTFNGKPDENSPVESVRVDRAHWPVRVDRATGRRDPEGRCANLSPGDLEVLQNGEPRPVTALGPRPLPRLHALLIDTSNSMQPRLARAKTAARDYIEALPDEDRVLVASFDESLVLATPATHDRSIALEAVEPLETGYYTSLWDALYYLTLHLETLAGEKVIVLLTDGEDSSSSRSFDEVVELAARTPNLSVFPIGLDLPSSVNLGVPMGRGRLGRLAGWTGGELSEIDRVAQLATAFDRIRERLDERLYVSYIPAIANEAGSGNGAGVEIRVRRGLPCRVESLGSRGRLGERSPGVTDELERQSPGEGDLVFNDRSAGACLVPDREPIAEQRFALPEGSRSGPAASLYTTDEPYVMFGRTTDFALDQGPLFRRKNSGKLRVTRSPEPVVVERAIEVATPPLELVRAELDSPEALLLFLLESAHCAPERTEQAPYARAPVIVHGKTFLELRELLGRTLFHAREDYREHAIERAARLADEEVRALLPELSEASDESGRDARLARAIVERAVDPARGRPHRFLAEWLGDVSAIDTIRALELRVANSVLRDAAGGDAERRAEVVRSAWYKLDRWFPPALDARILTPLVPAYDPQREAFGFYRFLLSWPRILDSRPDLLPPRPLALETVSWMRKAPGSDSLSRGRVGLASIEYVRLRGRKGRRACPTVGPGAVWRVAIEIEDRVGDPSEGLAVRAYFATDGRDDGRPACVSIDVPRDASETLRKLGRELRRTLSVDRS